jgi:hypothetical protein
MSISKNNPQMHKFPKNSNWTVLFIGFEVKVTNPHKKPPNGILRLCKKISREPRMSSMTYKTPVGKLPDLELRNI